MNGLLAEAQLNAGLSHRNIVRFRGIISASTPQLQHDLQQELQLGMVQEYVDGGTMKHRLEQGPLDPATIIDWASQIAKGTCVILCYNSTPPYST